MADRKVRYILEVDYTGESVTARAADDLREVDDAAKQASEGLEQAGGGFSKVQASIVTMQSALGIAEQGFAAIQQAAQFAYETLSEGAALVDARDDFNDLAASIGTTADAMEGELSAAAGGLVADAELIAQAGEMMSLGLGLSKDEIVQLTGLAAELDWNFKTLTDTLNTGSTRGLKELGLSIDEVKGKMAAFQEAGMTADEAFRFAIIEAAEEKLGRVGKKSEETSGQLQQLEVVVQNVQDAFAEEAAAAFADTLADIAGNAAGAGAGMELVAGGAGFVMGKIPELNAQLMGSVTLLDELATYAGILGLSLGYKFGEDDRERAQERRDMAAMMEMYGEEVEEVGEKSGKAAVYAEMMAGELGKLGNEIEAMPLGKLGEAFGMDGVAADLEELGGILGELRGDIDEAKAAWVAYTTEMTAQGGDYFTQFSQGADGAWDLEEAIYDAADAAGAGIKPLSDLAVQYEFLEQKAADAATTQAQQQIVIDNIAQAARDGKIAWEDYRKTVEDALDFLKNGYSDPVVRENPYAKQLADMNGIDPAEVPGIVDLPANIEFQLSANYQPVLDAVDAAKGAVNGFTESDPKVTMFMDIDEVETKAGRATELIEGIPEVKNVRIDVTATGMEILEELRAMGALP